MLNVGDRVLINHHANPATCTACTASSSNSTTDPELGSLIEEITVDCHDQDEQLMGFANASDEATFPYPGTVIGEEVEVLSVGVGERPELIATCTRGGRHYEIALLDVNVDADAGYIRSHSRIPPLGRILLTR